MLTRRFGWILPEAETIDSRSRVLIASTVTVTPVSFPVKVGRYQRPPNGDDGEHDQDVLSLHLGSGTGGFDAGQYEDDHETQCEETPGDWRGRSLV